MSKTVETVRGDEVRLPDIVERLRDIIKWVDENRMCIWVEKDVSELREAADEIERLRAALANAERALAAFDSVEIEE